ncbi:MAG: V-type ATP synthase subunit E [Clostridia bacterium]|jgi:V/A-type H+-transporting ATPase subunit E|nr:V-type ATP synthase subunit E [Clostridia bacterium]
MEIQIRDLIDQIKKDGVEAAETEAEAIISDAKAQAEKIIADAREQAEKLIANAKAENERTVKSGEDAIRQAGRNALISFRESVSRELEAILSENVSAVYSSEALAGLIVNIVEACAKAPDAEDITVTVTGDTLKNLESTILSALKAKMISGVTLKADDRLDCGFRISANNGSAYYDYSAEAVVEMLSNYLSPKVTNLLKEA